MINIDQVRARVEEIRRVAFDEQDDEAAHGEEDDLRRDVLQAIAEGAPNAKELAREALKTGELDFGRWCG